MRILPVGEGWQVVNDEDGVIAGSVVSATAIDRAIDEFTSTLKNSCVQVLLRRERPPQCSFFIHENALRMQVGSAALMNDQVLHLMFVADRPHVDIRVVPASAGAHPGLCGPFQLMGYDRQQPIVYLEHEVASLFLDTPDVIRRYERVFGKLEGAALDAGQSRSWLAELAGEYDRPREDADDHREDRTLAQE